MEKAVADFIILKQDFEQINLEKERVFANQEALVKEKGDVETRCFHLEEEKMQLSKELQEQKIEYVRLGEQLRAAESVKQNAIVSWEFAQQHATNMERFRHEADQRTTEAIKMRDEAINERSLAQEMLHALQMENAAMLVRISRSEQELHEAVHDKIRVEERTKATLHEWSKITLQAEDERKNIEREISFRTAKYRSTITTLEREMSLMSIERTDLTFKLNEALLHNTKIQKDATEWKKEVDIISQDNLKLHREVSTVTLARKRDRETLIRKKGHGKLKNILLFSVLTNVL